MRSISRPFWPEDRRKMPNRRTPRAWIGARSFIAAREQRDLRDLTRYRVSFVRERATLVNRVQKLLEGANLKLCSVLTNVMGVSGRAILSALLAGETDPQTLAELAVANCARSVRNWRKRCRVACDPSELCADRIADADRYAR